MSREQVRRSSGGAKLSRSETVTVRLDPKLNYLCDLAARAQRRTKSSFIEWAVSEALASVPIPGTNSATVDSYSEFLWDVEEADRLAQLAFNAPVLMTHEEQVVWKLIQGNGLLWRGRYAGPLNEWSWSADQASLRWSVYRSFYGTFKQVAEGISPSSDLPRWTQYMTEEEDAPPSSEAAFDSDLDEDLPF